MEVIVKRDASVEDVIGYALYQYIDDGRAPVPLPSLEAYSLRIVEDDGVIDNDFPALERSRKIEKFSFDQFALVEQDREKCKFRAMFLFLRASFSLFLLSPPSICFRDLHLMTPFFSSLGCRKHEEAGS